MSKFKVAVLMASYNGLAWLPSQLKSIMNQSGVEVTLYISDDCSQDGSNVYLQQFSLQNLRVNLFSQTIRSGSAGGNFYRLIREVNITDYEYVAFADQDDIWEHDKLIRHINLLKKHGVEGVSSNVMAFWPDGKKKLIKKSQPQRELDYLFESAGPGCTFLMTPWLVNELKQVLSDSSSSTIANSVALHDWLAYAVCRASGRNWFIDSSPSIQYRQHAHNVIGANIGTKAKLVRFRKMSDGWYRNEVSKVVQVCMTISDNPDLEKLYKYLTANGLIGKLGLLSFVCKARRGFYDRIFLALSILFGVF